MNDDAARRVIVDKASLPNSFPTHAHSAEFWEQLGRVVGTFGALEEVLGKAIFALTGTRPYEGKDPEQAVSAWYKTLERALTDPLVPLIGSFERAVRDHPRSTLTNLDTLTTHLREAAALRNALCHGSWQEPDARGASKPLFVDRGFRVFDTAVDVQFLIQTQKHVAELVCEVISVVTHMGFQFPGTEGPGRPVW